MQKLAIPDGKYRTLLELYSVDELEEIIETFESELEEELKKPNPWNSKVSLCYCNIDLFCALRSVVVDIRDL